MGFSEYLVFFLMILLVPLYLFYKKLRRIEKFCKQYPNPPTVPFFGNALEFTSTTAFLKNLHKYTKTYGSMVHLKMGPFGHVLVTSDRKFIEFILNHPKVMNRIYVVKFLEPWTGTGLATVKGGPKWKRHRKIITPAFHYNVLEQFFDVFESCGNILIRKLSKMSGNKNFDIYPFITRWALDVICETAMGTKMNVQEDETSAYFESVKEMCRICLDRMLSIWKSYDFLFWFSEDYNKQKKALEVLHGYTDRIIKAKREERKRMERHKNDEDDFGRKKKKAFLDLLLDASANGQQFSDEEIKEEVETFMFTGHETTTAAISFILYFLASNKEAQNKILDEQQQLFGDEKNPKVMYSDLQEMKYLENAIKEGLRLCGAASFYGREVDQDIEYDGMTIPNGTTVLIFAQGIHMDPQYYPNPERFDPNRFDNMDEKLPYAFIPFGGGPRICIGQKFAMLEMKSVISKIVRNFELFPAVPRHEMELAPEIVLKSLNGVKVGLKQR